MAAVLLQHGSRYSKNISRERLWCLSFRGRRSDFRTDRVLFNTRKQMMCDNCSGSPFIQQFKSDLRAGFTQVSYISWFLKTFQITNCYYTRRGEVNILVQNYCTYLGSLEPEHYIVVGTFKYGGVWSAAHAHFHPVIMHYTERFHAVYALTHLSVEPKSWFVPGAITCNSILLPSPGSPSLCPVSCPNHHHWALIMA